MKSLIAAAVIAALPMVASAATHNSNIASGDQVVESLHLTTVDSVAEFTFTATDDLQISSFIVAGTGSRTNLEAVTHGFGNPGTEDFLAFDGGPDVWDALAFLSPTPTPLVLSAGEMVSIFFTGVVDADTLVTVQFGTQDPVAPPVPLPAAGLLLGSVLLGGSLMGRKKKS